MDELNSVTFDEVKFDSIVNDINTNVSKPSLTSKDLDDIGTYLNKNIDQKSYSSAELNTGLSKIKEQITKINFSKNDILNASKQVKILQAKIFNTLNPLNDFSGLSFREILNVSIKLLFRTFTKIIDDFVVMAVSIFIMLNLQLRASVPTSLIYPSNPNTFPYVYFDETNHTNQSYLTSLSETNKNDTEDVAFLDTPAFFTSDGKYSLDKNICKINDPYGSSSMGEKAKCKIKGNPDLTKAFNKNISYENLNLFARKFMESNSSKKSSELSVYSLITYMMLYITISTNGSLGGINDFFNVLFKKNEKPGITDLFLFVSIVLMFYALFQSTKFSFSNMIKKLMFGKKLKKINKFNIFGTVINIISAFFSPFVMFYKIMFVIIYPLIMFHSIYGYINYSSLSSGLLTKIFCIFGIVVSFTALLAYFILFSKVITNKRKTLDDIFQDMIKEIVDQAKNLLRKISSTEKKLKKQQKSMNNTSSGKGSKVKKGGGNETNDETVYKGKKNDETVYKGKGQKGGESTVTCNDSLFEFSFFKSIFSFLAIILILPFAIISFVIPAMLSIQMAFVTTKSVTFDYLKYMKPIICNMSPYKLIIRLLFYTITIIEIIKYMKKPFKILTAGVLAVIILQDIRKDFVKQSMIINKCAMEDSGLEIGEKISEMVLSNNEQGPTGLKKYMPNEKTAKKAALIGAETAVKMATGI